ncbi:MULTISPECIES: isocitrate lyase/phosphoenolpyruvate mutase family protein [unclassified Pseudonocardia]|uniref:isocitrate lyase/phosphoenolpyruvate mutase family protein n=1 Tax=unclassified Pseudonocardia TaxID=2619320 RepID=UPI001CF68DFE|nr:MULTISPECIES: isocitrate lyase/phosphoenolpyruvate mutase family protein [unclassified Pseudonocardia]
MLQTDVPPTRRRVVLRAALDRPRAGRRPLRFHTVTTAASARQIAAMGLDGVHVAAADTGGQDAAELVARIVRATPLPVLVDLGPTRDADTVAHIAAAGASGVLLDDTSPDDGAAGDVETRVRTAVRARHDPALLIGVRTTTDRARGLVDTIDRARARLAAGADLVVVEAPASRATYPVLREALTAPLFVTATPVTGGDPTSVLLPTVTQLAAFGMDAVIHPVTGPRSPAATDRGSRIPRDTGTPRGLADALLAGARRDAVR